jgi:hypothetical protein
MSRRRNTNRDPTNGRLVGFEPTEAEKIAVATLANNGMPQEQICEYIRRDGKPINHQTLRKHFRVQLTEGMTSVRALMYRSLVHKAIIEGNVIAQIFYLKTQCGWSENRRAKPGSRGPEDTRTRGEVAIKVCEPRIR